MAHFMETTAAPEPVAVAGYGAVTALGLGTKALEDALRTNASGLRIGERWSGKGYARPVAGYIAEDVFECLRAATPDPSASRPFLLGNSAIAQAREHLALELCNIPATRRGLVLSTTKGNIEALEQQVLGKACSPLALRHLQPAWLARDLATAHEVGGPVQCVSAACISGLLAIQQGAVLIRRRRADLVLVVGVDVVSHFVLAGFAALKALDPEGCRPFDRERAGLSLGEGAGAIVLVRQDLLRSAPVVISGWGSSNDANHLTGPSRDGSGLALAISRALGKAAVPSGAVDYIHAHGTGTPYNDNMEVMALRTVFGERVPPFSSSKGMIGHTLGAAGVLETILCLLAFTNRILPGTPRLRIPDPVAPDSLLVAPKSGADVRCVLKMNCGFGGTNSAIVLQRLSP
jgi:3-oxoacyl-[acyl-carrier-protein] synthase II